jgi:hypothetical protein
MFPTVPMEFCYEFCTMPMQHIQTDQYNSDIGYQIEHFMMRPLLKFWVLVLSCLHHTILLVVQWQHWLSDSCGVTFMVVHYLHIIAHMEFCY